MGDIMKENQELLKVIHDNVKMGINSTTKLLDILKDKDNKIKGVIEDELKKYEEFLKRCANFMKRENLSLGEGSVFTQVTTNIIMSIEALKDNSDSKISSILIRGFTSGNIDLESKINDYKNEVSEDVLSLAKEVLRFGEKEIDILKSYL